MFFNPSEKNKASLTNALNELLSRSEYIGDKKYAYWPYLSNEGGISKTLSLGGFAHGSAGTAYVLYKLYKYTENEDIYKLFISTIAHDRNFYESKMYGWRDGRNSGKIGGDMGAWCHGAAGIAV